MAEGVESQYEADFLRQLGCDIGQGYLFSRPLNHEMTDQWLRMTHEKVAVATY